MIVSIFFVLDTDDRVRFLEKRFLLADVNPNIVFKIFFPTMSNINLDF